MRELETNFRPELILNLLKHILDPQKRDLTSLVIARFCISALRYLEPTIEPHLDMIIRALVSKIHSGSAMLYDDYLIIIFAYLFNLNVGRVCMILSNIPGPEGDSALKFVFVRWIKKHNYYTGRYERNLR